MDKPLCVAIIGCGVIGPEHIRGYQRIDGVTVRWVCDLVTQKAEKAAADFGIPRQGTDYRRVLDDPAVDCISICTDHAAHVPIAVDALTAGKHVLCEKALASSRAGLDEMMKAAKNSPGQVFSGVFQHRFDATFRAAKEMVEQGALGKILTASLSMCCLRTNDYYRADAWRGTWAQEGGAALINQSIHYVDILAWIMASIASVSAVYANLTHGSVLEAEDTASASVQFASGALGTISATTSSHLEWEPMITIRGTEGSVNLLNAEAVMIACADGERKRDLTERFASCKDAQKRTDGKAYYGPNHHVQLADFVNAVRTGGKPFVPAQSARHAVDIVLSIYESHRTGKRVVIDNAA